MPDQHPRLLCEPYLLDPHGDGVHVLWHTEHPGLRHVVLTGPAVAGMSAPEAVAAATGEAAAGASGGAGSGWRRYEAVTTRLRRMREDADSDVPGRDYQKLTERPVHRHLARVTGLAPGRTPYRVVSVEGAGRAAVSPVYTLAPAVPADRGVRLLLTSDHQLNHLTPANIEAVAAVTGSELDGVLAAGDLVNHPDRASDWFDSGSGRAFFAVLAGRGRRTIAGRTYRGAPLLPHAPLYPAIGNHEVMGRWSTTASLDEQFHDAVPHSVADDGWDVTTYEQLFPYPRSDQGGRRWWARTIGDVHVTALFVTHAWRPVGGGGRGRFQEAPEDLAHPDRWGHGQHLFEPVRRGSRQYEWLAATLASPAARAARYRVVMFHNAGHGLGVHTSPGFIDPVRTVHRDPATGVVTAVAYHYPKAEDQLLRDLEPLFSQHGVNLVLSGHSHLWNRFRNAAGVNWLETSNVGNSVGAYHPTSGRVRPVPDHPDYVAQGDPGGLTPIVPTVAPLAGPDGAPLPYLASDDITAFSLLDSAAGVVRSYRFDTRTPDSDPVLFDEFPLA